MQVTEAIAKALVELGVRRSFGLVGSGNYQLTEALQQAGATFTSARHEGGSITMADAYARVTGEVPVCTVHQGPGVTNMATGLAEAAKSRTPLLVLAAESSGPRSNFRIDQPAFATSLGAIAERIQSPATAAADCVRVHRRARLERRPVVLNLPLELLTAETGPAPLPATPDLAPAVPAPGSIAAAVKLLETAQRPLILAGRGAVLGGAGPALEALGDRIGAVFATSAVANGLFGDNPWSVGISGGFASTLASELIAESDVVLAVGASLNMWTTRHGRLLGPGTAVVQIDVDPGEIGANVPAAIAVVGDAGAAAQALAGQATPGAGRRTTALAARIEAWREAGEPFEDASTDSRIDPRTASQALDRMLPRARTVVTDSGGFMAWPAQYLRVPDAAGFCFTQAFQAVGIGLASAIGAAVARPDRLTVAAVGDGGLLMGLADLETVARLGPRMLVAVYNDAAYGAEVHHFEPAQRGTLVHFPDTDFAALARAAGLAGVTVRRREDLDAVAAWVASGSCQPLLADLKIVPTVVARFLQDAFGH